MAERLGSRCRRPARNVRTVPRARLVVDLNRIEHNARTLVNRLPGVDIVGVTKVSCGDGRVAAAMVEGGVKALADSRHANLVRLREAAVDVPVWLLRGSRPDEAAETVRLADVSLNSELETVVALDEAAAHLGGIHRVVIMVDLGDLREGLLPEEVALFLEAVLPLRHISLEGLGTNLSCYGGIVPTPENLGELVELAKLAEEMFGRSMTVSGGNSSTLDLALSGDMPERIDNLRLGESILLGMNTLTRKPLMPELDLDAFTISAPVIECKLKPSVPVGDIAQDAFGNKPEFVDRGLRMRAICALGRQDAPPQGLTPHDPGVVVLGASSDHLVLDVHELDVPPEPGDSIDFRPNYAALLQAYTSPYVEKAHVSDSPAAVRRKAGARREGTT